MHRMIPWIGLLTCCAFVGCGPMTGPMPMPLPDDKQKEVDDSWNQALAPVGKHDRQTWLDVLVTAYPYQAGVDELHLRSVKKWEGGTVVMEIRIDRAKPDDDFISITALDKDGKEVRAEKYPRWEVERAAMAFEGNQPNGQRMTAEQEVAQVARVKRVEGIMPDFVFRTGERRGDAEK